MNMKALNSNIKVSFKEKISYAFGDLSNNIIYGSMGAFLVFYYTDVAKVSAAAIGSIMIISRLLDGILDILMGIIVDKTKTKYGKARPWLLRMAIPFGIAAVLMFSVPDSLTDKAKLIYIFITYNLVNIIYTSINVPYGVLGSLITQDQYERSLLNIIRMIFAIGSNLAITTLTLPFVKMLGGGSKAWTLAYAIFGVIATVLYFISFFNTKERVELSENKEKFESVPIGIGVKSLFKNKYWVILTLVGLSNGVMMGVMVGMGVYYSQYILKDSSLTGIITMCLYLPMLLAMFLLPPFVKRFGKRNVAIVGLFIMVLGCLVTIINPSNVTIVIIGSILKGIGFSPIMGVNFAMLADTVEYGEWKFKIRTEGLIFSAQSYGGKAGSGLGSAIIGWILAFGGYVGGAATQSATALSSIKFLFIAIPIVFVAIEIILLLPYKLDKEYPKILSELKARKK
ncbi:MFS transporter [Clostridium felsineum]|uniref:MFS transporter n=1 Tax=Clostridium felsineum TaxID=36839 RepID=UPI00214D73CE|nr:MFS transporter [Clostridium felsineum]MCR3759582.1 MFS transporter [Clostridium felsineum]